MYQSSVSTNNLPLIWKSVTVTPVFKKVDCNKAVNYCAISLTSICYKVLEHIIHSSIMCHFDTHEIFTNFQHGFRKQCSCESQLIITVDELAHNLDTGLQMDLILLYFSKVLDKVPH